MNGERTVCAIVRYGKGQVMAVSFGNMFNDKNMGNDWWHDPDLAERARYDVLFALLQRLVKDKPIVVPARSMKSTEPKISVPLNRPARRDTGAATAPRGDVRGRACVTRFERVGGRCRCYLTIARISSS